MALTTRHPRAPSEHRVLRSLLDEHLDWLRIKGYSDYTVRSRFVHIRFFLRWCAESRITALEQITADVLREYQQDTLEYRKRNGQPLALCSRFARLVPLRVWFRWMSRQRYDNPQTWNAYAYVVNNPLRYIDPDGLAHWQKDKDGVDRWVGDKDGECDKQNNTCWNAKTQSWDTPEPRDDGAVGPGFLGPADVFFIRVPNLGITSKIAALFGRTVEKAAIVGTEKVAADTTLKISQHALEEAAKDGVSKEAIKTVIRVGEKFFDPKNNSIVSVVRGGMASGKNIAVAQDAVTGTVKTVFTSSKSVISSRFIPVTK